MPLYQYRCAQCRAVFDERRSFTDLERPADCPDCHGEDTRREITVPQVFSLGTALDPGSAEARANSGGPQCSPQCGCHSGSARTAP